MVVVIGVTTALVAEPPGRAATAEAVSVTSTVGALDLKLTVAPARVGPNELHVYVLDPRNGAPRGWRRSPSRRRSRRPAIGPLRFNPFPPGPATSSCPQRSSRSRAPGTFAWT